jgi:hypothetical protein
MECNRSRWAETVNLGGYIGIPDTLPEAQQMIVRLMDEAKANAKEAQQREQVLDRAVKMVENARKALNATEASGK